MPTSQHQQINEIMSFINWTKPEKLLDIGVGFGKYGFLSRECLELWTTDNHYSNNKWTTEIDGIEVFEKYITPVHKYIYNHIYIGNAIDILPTLEKRYDLILLIDVLEHFDYNQGMLILEQCEIIGTNMIISVPTDIGSQEDCFDNPYERHKFQWTKNHFNSYNSKFIIPNVGGSMIIYLGKNSQKMKKLWKQRFSLLRMTILKILDLVRLKKIIKRIFLKRKKLSSVTSKLLIFFNCIILIRLITI